MKPKVLHIGNELSWRGGENQILLLCQGAQSDFDFFIAYPKGSRGLKKFSEHGFPCLELPTVKPSLRNHWALKDFVTKNQIQLIDAQSSGGHSMALRLKKSLPHLKLVVHRRVDNVIKRQFFTRRKYLSPLVDHFVCISRKIQEMVTQYGVPTSKVSLVPSAVDGSKYDRIDKPTARQHLLSIAKVSDSTSIIGNASAFTDQKDPVSFVRAIAELAKSDVLFTAFMAGDGPLLDDCKALAKQLQVDDKIHFLGFIDWVPSFLSGLDILFVPSSNEGLGTIVLDGIWAEAAVAASAVGGIPEMIKPEQTGLLFPPRDAQAMANALKALCQSSEACENYRIAARKLVEEQFSLKAMVQGNSDIYRRLLTT